MHLDIKMREIQKSGKIIGMEKCAIMAALNITHELLSAQVKQGESDKLVARVSTILNKLDVAMQEQAQLSIQSNQKLSA
jgi:cell division protein ZapA